MFRKNYEHAIQGFRHILLAKMFLSRPVGGSPCFEDIACNSDTYPENSRRQNIKYDRIELSYLDISTVAQ
jgi:hypothetical protein